MNLSFTLAVIVSTASFSNSFVPVSWPPCSSTRAFHGIQTSTTSAHTHTSATALNVATEPSAAAGIDTNTYDYIAWKNGFSSAPSESCQILEGGSIPADLKGTYFRNGYGKFEVGAEKVMHPFDADGLMNAITIQDGKATFRNRFVRTKGFQKERRYRKVMYRGAFGTQRSGGPLSNIFDTSIKNVANTNSLYWAGRLFALWEGGLPHRMEPDSLRTVGEYTFKGLLKKGSTFSAHPRVCSTTKRLINFSPAQGASKCDMTIYEFDEELKVQKQRTVEIPGFVFFHDFIVTENYYIFNRAPTSFDPIPFLLGLKGPAQCISYEKSQPAILYLVPRDADRPMEIVEVDSHFNFHFANGFEDKDGNIIFDVVRCANMQLGADQGKEPVWETVNYAKEVPFSTLSRYTLTKSDSGWNAQQKQLSDTQVDFTSVDPKVSCKEHRYVYASCGSDNTKSTPPQGIVCIDTIDSTEQKWMPEKDEFLGENIFVAREGATTEGDGYVLTILTNGATKTSDFLVFDALKIQQGPISRQSLPSYVPFGLHGTWAQGVVSDSEDIIRKWKAASSIDNKNWNEVKSDFSGLGVSYDF